MVSGAPTFIVYLQGLLVPVIGILGALIAYQQMKIAKQKFKLDLFEKRYAILAAMKKFCSHAISHGGAKGPEAYELMLALADGRFLFDDDMKSYLQEFSDNAWQLYVASDAVASPSDGNSDASWRKEQIEKKYSTLN